MKNHIISYNCSQSTILRCKAKCKGGSKSLTNSAYIYIYQNCQSNVQKHCNTRELKSLMSTPILNCTSTAKTNNPCSIQSSLGSSWRSLCGEGIYFPLPLVKFQPPPLGFFQFCISWYKSRKPCVVLSNWGRGTTNPTHSFSHSHLLNALLSPSSVTLCCRTQSYLCQWMQGWDVTLVGLKAGSVSFQVPKLYDTLSWCGDVRVLGLCCSAFKIEI